MTNPLLEDRALPAFERIEAHHVEPAIDQLLASGRALIEQLTARPEVPTWENFVDPIEEEDDRLDRAWSPVSHLNATMNHEALRTAYNACLPKLSDYGTEIGQNEALFQAYQQVAAQPGLSSAQRRMLDNCLRDFRLSGVALSPEKKVRFRLINQELSRLSSQFEEHLLDATNAWSKSIDDPQALAGLPESALALLRQQARERDLTGWLLTLDMPAYLPVMMYAEDRTLRRELYTAYGTRASDQGPHAGQWDNGPLMEEILALRHERAQLLGFANYAELSLEPKMASDTHAVMQFLNDLAARSLPQARRELEELRDFARSLGVDQLEPWDLPYVTEKLRQHRYALNQEELRPYFPAPRVLRGLFTVAERLFGLRIAPTQGIETWHPAVEVYAIYDHKDVLRAYFYLDLYARAKKRGGAWMDGAVSRLKTRHREQLPAAYLVCNFSPPVDDQPSLLTHDEVQTLFHEFGHGLHHLLTKIDHAAIAGIHGVPWDAVELPSQFLENWCWERDTLDLISEHVNTKEPLPEVLFERMIAAKHFQTAMQMVRQLEFALFDFRVHLEYDPARGAQINEKLAEVREQVAVIQPPPFHRFAHGFSHIFAGGYGAGYYSYKWAELLSADAFSLFEERGIFDAATGQAFRETILESGGAVDAMELFIAFRGRAPRIDAMLRHSGIEDH